MGSDDHDTMNDRRRQCARFHVCEDTGEPDTEGRTLTFHCPSHCPTHRRRLIAASSTVHVPLRKRREREATRSSNAQRTPYECVLGSCDSYRELCLAQFEREQSCD
jgi:hypothetical protein